METTEYDLIILGGGAVAENVADRAVQGGLSAVLIEHELVGGECSYWACTPSKALLRPAGVLREARDVEGAAEAATGQLDIEAILRRRDRLVHDWSDDSQVKWVESAGIGLIRGHGRLVGPRSVEVTEPDGSTTVLTARSAVTIATGSEPLIPDIPGLADVEYWTSRDATSVQKIPESLIVIGGGVVGCEIATAFAGFGTTVTIIARHGLLASAEPFAVEMVTASLRDLGVTVLLDTDVLSAAKSPDGITIEVTGGDTITAEKLLVATGRAPRSTEIGLESIGLEPGQWLQTDDTMRVPGFDWLYAVGDITHRALLTHQGKYQARAAGDVIAARAKGEPVDDAPWGVHVATADHEAVPQVTFTQPEVASVGLTAAEAEKAGYTFSVTDYDLYWLTGTGVRSDHYSGQARMIVDEDREVIIGMTFVGPDVGEMLQSATIAVVGQIPIARLWHAVPAFPTVSELWLRLLEARRANARAKTS